MFQDISRVSEGIGSAEDCLDLGHQYVHIKRLGNKVIGSAADNMTMFMLSAAEEMKITGTWETFRISSHQ